MVLFLLVLALSLATASFFGHVVHWLLHQRWSGPAFRAHMEHHWALYPPSDLVSDTYRSPRWYNNGTFLFTPPFVVILGAVCGLALWLGAPLWSLVTFGVVMLAFSLGNDAVHNTYHTRSRWLMRFGWYGRLRVLHYVHHHNMGKNLGIANFAWDRVFRTFSATR